MSPSGLSDLGRRRALDAVLGTANLEIPSGWTAEVEMRASWSTSGSRWLGLLRRGWEGFWHPWPVPHTLTWRTERQPIRLRRTASGFENEDTMRWDLLSVPPAPPRSDGWMPLAVNIYDGTELVFSLSVPQHRLLPPTTHPGGAAEFAPGSMTLSID